MISRLKRFVFNDGRPILFTKYKFQNRTSPVLHGACCQDWTSLVLWFVEAVSQAALPAVVTVKVTGHEHPGSTLICRTLAAQAVDLAVFINLRIKTDSIKSYKKPTQTLAKTLSLGDVETDLVIFQHRKLDLLSLVLVLLGGGVGLLLPLLSTTTQSQHKMQCGLLNAWSQWS